MKKYTSIVYVPTSRLPDLHQLERGMCNNINDRESDRQTMSI